MTGIGTGVGKVGSESTRRSTREGMEAETGMETGKRTGTIIEIRVESRESVGTYDVVIEVVRKTQKRGRRQRRKQHPQSQDPMFQRNRRVMLRTRASAREARNRIEEGGRKVEKRKKLQRSFRRDVGSEGGLGGNRNKRRQESVEAQ